LVAGAAGAAGGLSWVGVCAVANEIHPAHTARVTR